MQTPVGLWQNFWQPTDQPQPFSINFIKTQKPKLKIRFERKFLTFVSAKMKTQTEKSPDRKLFASFPLRVSFRESESCAVDLLINILRLKLWPKNLAERKVQQVFLRKTLEWKRNFRKLKFEIHFYFIFFLISELFSTKIQKVLYLLSSIFQPPLGAFPSRCRWIHWRTQLG